MIKAIALDDEPPALDVINTFCRAIEYLDLVKTFTKTEEATNYLAQFPVDLVFLDINMPSVSGLDFKKMLDPKMMVIFTTAYSEFALEGFNLNAVDYLLKPFTRERFQQAAEKAKGFFQFLHQNPASKPDHILLRVDYSLVKVDLDDIIFIEALDDYLQIYLKGQKPLIVRMTLKAMLEKLPQTDFVRVHRSYVVALKKIKAVRNKIILIGEKEIPIGSNFAGKLLEALGGKLD